MKYLPLTLLSICVAAPFAAGWQDPADVPDEEVSILEQTVLPPAEETMMLRLRTGAIHWGAIAGHDPEGMEFTLLSHGGTVRLDWSLLDPSQEIGLRERFGYVDVSTEELMVEVETVVLIDGTEISGVILSREGDHFVLKYEGSLQMLPKKRVQKTFKGGLVPALDVYSREELYSMHLAKTDLEDAEAQLELAKVCEQILDFIHAVEHYEMVGQLDPLTERKEVDHALARARLKAEQQEQIDYLREVDILRRRKSFDEALVLAEEFSERYPDSPLVLDAQKLRDKVLIARDDTIRDLVRRRWLDHTGRIARSAAKQIDSYEGAVAYVDEQYHEDVLAAVTADVHRRISDSVEPEEVIAYWATRKLGRFQNATYGLGTWMLGEEAALAGTASEEGDSKSGGNERDAEREALEQKIEKFLSGQRKARQRRTQEEEADEYDQYWKRMSVDDRAQWLRAYYAENSGDFELRDRPYLHRCPTCAGQGVREIINASAGTSSSNRDGGGRNRGGNRGNASSNSGPTMVACNTCKGIGRQRRIYYR